VTAQKVKVVSAEHFFQIPEPLPGQILIAPVSNKLLEPDTMPIDNSASLPEWFRALDKDKPMRRCQGTYDWVRNGVTLRTPADIEFRVGPDGVNWQARYAANLNELSSSLDIQAFQFASTGATPTSSARAYPESLYVKVINPWKIKTAPGWSTLSMPVYWDRPSRDWEVIPGCVNTDYYHSAHWVINIFTDTPFVIPSGTPIVHLVTVPRADDIGILIGDHKVANILENRGFGGFVVPKDRRVRYRREQRRAGFADCPHVAEYRSNRPWWRSFFSSGLGKN